MSEDDTVGDVMELVMFFPSLNLLMSHDHTVLMVGLIWFASNGLHSMLVFIIFGQKHPV